MGLRSAGLVLIALVACGPRIGGEGSDGGSGGGATGIPPSAVTASSTSGRRDGTTGLTDTTASSAPIGESCSPNPPAVEPPLPDGCEHVWLRDEAGEILEGMPSGLVRCPERGNAPRDFYSTFRTAAVPCAFVAGDCLCDADCGSGEQCICDNAAFRLEPRGNRCLVADCTSDAECSEGVCRVDDAAFCLGGGPVDVPTGIFCTSPSDDCSAHADCWASSSVPCGYDRTVEMFTCSPGAICE